MSLFGENPNGAFTAFISSLNSIFALDFKKSLWPTMRLKFSVKEKSFSFLPHRSTKKRWKITLQMAINFNCHRVLSAHTTSYIDCFIWLVQTKSVGRDIDTTFIGFAATFPHCFTISILDALIYICKEIAERIREEAQAMATDTQLVCNMQTLRTTNEREWEKNILILSFIFFWFMFGIFVQSM